MALEMMREMRATVLRMGESVYPDGNYRCKVGDNVLISKFAGTIVKGPLDNKIYRIVNDEDIFCRIQGDLSKMIIEDPVL
ncbi:hypothetical protein ACKI10_46905, partial [Streptomyces galilaeus]|uniref:hypothetical protein n=1 Tax=Streptomyces galilaeus TaxID=33899 RepID=UPI0038F729E7